MTQASHFTEYNFYWLCLWYVEAGKSKYSCCCAK